MKRAAIYARVSPRNRYQHPETQLLALRQVAERAGWQVVEEYVDHGISGAKGRDKRPAFDQLMKDARRRRFDVVMAWSVDRLGRSLQDLVGFLGEIHAQGVDLYLDRQGVDTTTPGGKALFQMMGVGTRRLGAWFKAPGGRVWRPCGTDAPAGGDPSLV
jgi:DNA invertase Pin-like site-specific DNA recombinase